MVRVNWYLLCKLQLVHGLENRQALSNGLYANLLEALSIQQTQHVSRDAVHYGGVSTMTSKVNGEWTHSGSGSHTAAVPTS